MNRFTCIAITYTAKTQHSLCSYTQNDSNVFAHTLQLIYDTHTVIVKARLSFCTYTHLCNAVNLSISIFWLMYMRCNIHRTTATSLRTRCNSYTSHTYTAKAWLSFCASTRSWNAVNRLIFRLIESIYMHRNHIHCKDTTQSLLIYTEQQQHLCARAATNIRHSHSHCEGTTQLLHT